jgi:hypothetical protein
VSERGRVHGRWIVAAIVVLAAALRFTLFQVSPPSNANDDHLEPIGHYASHWTRPAPDACWQCYQPPLYYVTSAAILSGVHAITGDVLVAWRAVQLEGLFFSLAQLVLVWCILARVGARERGPRIAALVVLACLPRELYGAVFVSNDVLLGFLATLAVYVHVGANASALTTRRLVAVLGAVALAAFTKQHGLILAVLPAALVAEHVRREVVLGSATLPALRPYAPWLAAGLLVVVSEELYKAAVTGHWLVSNQHYFDWPKVQKPGSVGAISFFDLRLATLFEQPTSYRATVGSFWTQLFAKLWFDYDPKFTIGSALAGRFAVASYVLGLGFAVAWAVGGWRAIVDWRGRVDRIALGVVQLAFLAVPLAQTLRFPYYSSMKAVFLLPAASIGVVFLSHGFAAVWQRRIGRLLVIAWVSALVFVMVGEVALITQEAPDALMRSLRGNKLWRLPEAWR